MPIYPSGYSLAEELPRRVIWTTDADWNKGILGNDTEVSGTGSTADIRPNSYPVPASFIYLTWNFNELVGPTVIDSSQYGRNGTLVTAEGNQPAQFLTGKLLNAYYNPGEYEGGDYIDGGNVAGFEWSQPFSIDCWIKPSPGYGTLTIASKYDTVNNTGWMFQWQDDYLRLDLSGDATYRFQTYADTALAGDGNFHHAVVTYDGSGIAAGVKFYIDGVLVGNSTYYDGLASTTIINSENFRVAAMPLAGWIGGIDAFNIYTKVLSQTEVDTRYNTGTGTESPLALDVWYKAAAHYETNVFDSNVTSLSWGTLGAIKVLPSGTTLTIKVRASNDSDAMGSYSAALTTGSPLNVTGQYIQFSVDFTGTTTERSELEYVSALYTASSVQDMTP
jgi:hypothetical protein